jgi:hypothetical protein
MSRRIPRSRRSRGDTSVTIVGNDFIDLSFVSPATYSSLSFQPSAFARLTTFRTLYEQYRLNWLEITSLPSNTTPVSIGYLSGNTLGTFTGWAMGVVANLDPSVVWFPGEVVPVRLHVPRNKIGAPLNWMLTTNNSGPSGVILAGGTGSSVGVKCRIRYSVTFRAPVYQGFQTVGIDEEKSDTVVVPPVQPQTSPPPLLQGWERGMAAVRRA